MRHDSCGVLLTSLVVLSSAAMLLAAPRGGNITGVVVAERPDEQNQSDLLIEPEGEPDQQIDQIAVRLPKWFKNHQVEIGHLPNDWTMKVEMPVIQVSGPPMPVPDLRVRIDLGDAQPPDRVSVECSLDGKPLFEDKKVAVGSVPAVELVTSLDDLLQPPRVVSPVDPIQFGLLDPDRTQGWTWDVEDVGAGEPVTLDSAPGDPGTGPSFTYPTPPETGSRDLVVSGYEEYGQLACEAEVELNVVPTPATLRPYITDCTPMSFPGHVVCVCGYFPGADALAGILFDGEPLGEPISGSSFVAFYRLPQESVAGEHTVSGDEGAGYGEEDQAQVVALTVGGEIDQNKLLRGQSTSLRLWIDGSQLPIGLELENHTPGIVTLDRGNKQIAVTSGGAPNQVTRMVHAVSPGDFNLTYQLDADPCPCADDAGASAPPAYTPTQQMWTDLLEADRARIRETLNFFTSTKTRPYNLSSVLELIRNEAIRIGAVDGAEYVVELPDFDLTAPDVLPEFDAAGNFDATGGYTKYEEPVHNLNGEETFKSEVHKRNEQFSSGTLDCDLGGSAETMPGGTTVTEQSCDFTVTDNIEFKSTAWNQQRSRTSVNGGPPHDETYTYQEWPNRDITIKSGGSCTLTEVTDDVIHSEQGYDAVTTESIDCNMEGTFTLFQPKAIDENIGARQASNPQTVGNTTTDRFTTVEPEGTAVTTTTTTTTETVDPGCPCTTCTVFGETVVLRSTRRGYTVAEGTAKKARVNRTLEKFIGYVETTKTTTTVNVTCQPNGSFTVDDVIIELKYTDNPATRNVVTLPGPGQVGWGSSRTSKTTTFDSSTGTTIVTDHGTEWLTDRIEPDPEVNDLPWKMEGRIESTPPVRYEFFGDDFEAIQTATEQTRTFGVTYTLGSTEVTLDGAISRRRARPRPNLESDHQQPDGVSGNVELIFDDTPYALSGPEFETALEP
jgi:hypothetical protein